MTEAQKRAQKKFEAKTYDRISIRLPKGTLDRIKALGCTANGVGRDTILAWLDEQEKKNN